MGCISEPVIGDVQASRRHVSTNEMTGRKITTPKRDRATDPTSEIENFQIFVCILGLSGLVKYILDLVFCKIVRRFAGDTDILRVKSVILVCEPIKRRFPAGLRACRQTCLRASTSLAVRISETNSGRLFASRYKRPKYSPIIPSIKSCELPRRTMAAMTLAQPATARSVRMPAAT